MNFSTIKLNRALASMLIAVSLLFGSMAFAGQKPEPVKPPTAKDAKGGADAKKESTKAKTKSKAEMAAKTKPGKKNIDPKRLQKAGIGITGSF